MIGDMVIHAVFQSTLPVGGATGDFTRLDKHHQDFNPRSPWGERQCSRPVTSIMRYFNPRSPWGERRDHSAKPYMASLFQSTLPVGGATVAGSILDVYGGISIHAPRGGSDSKNAQILCPSLAIINIFSKAFPQKPCLSCAEGQLWQVPGSKTGCEPAGNLCALEHRNQIIRVSSGR